MYVSWRGCTRTQTKKASKTKAGVERAQGKNGIGDDYDDASGSRVQVE